MFEILKSDNNYPVQLLKLLDPPDKIYFEGDLSLFEKKYISVVGAREIQPWVKDWMENELYNFLLNNNIGIISGGARGVDQWAHWLCIRTGRPTIVVLPSAVDQKYPQSIEKFTNYKSVGFLSEYDPGECMRKHFFYKRNRLIAALTSLTLVVQASEKSGTIITAKYSLELGNVLAAIPGSPTDQNMGGNNQILFDGGQIIRDRFDLQSLINSLN
jgi:DNA processing protein